MGHFSTAKVLFEAGADPDPPHGLFRNIWDSKELRNLVKNLENHTDQEYFLPSLLNEAAVQFINMGQKSNAEEMYRRALEGYEKVLGLEHPLTLASVSNLAWVLQDQRKYEAAEEMYRRALKEYEKVLGLEHPSTLTCISNLAWVLQEQGKYEAAEKMYRRALEGYERLVGVEHPSTLTCISNLAWVLQDQGKYEAAEEMKEKRRRWESSIPPH
jgi:tetratricopeptide (TPR) repeat protein